MLFKSILVFEYNFSLLAIDNNDPDWKRMPNYQYDPMGFIKWLSLAPIKLLFYYTIPDCRQPRFILYFCFINFIVFDDRWFQWYPITFIMSIVWLCVFTYLMVWMVTIIGFTFGIPDSIMGITFLAAGSSVPDALSSVLVVRQGQ